MKKKAASSLFIAILLVSLSVSVFSGTLKTALGDTPPTTLGPTALSGAGGKGSFAEFIDASAAYYTMNIRSNLQVNYQGIGGQEATPIFLDNGFDFVYIGAPEASSSYPTSWVTMPETIGSIALVYNLPRHLRWFAPNGARNSRHLPWLHNKLE